jgi:iron-sulfur cluster assembly protein
VLALTRDATTAIKEIVSASPLAEGGGLRITAAPGEDGTTGLQLALAGEPSDADQVIEEDEARVFLEPLAAAALDDKVLDAQAEETGVTFLVTDQP